MNNLQDILGDLNDAWKKNVENTPFWDNLQAEWKKIFESPQNWWDKLPLEWQKVFRTILKIYDNRKPTDAQLKEILSLNKLDCSDSGVVNLDPIRNLKYLQEINLSNTDIVSLEPLQNLVNLLKINCSNTHIHDLKPLKKLKNLRVLNCSMTDVEDLRPIKKLITLKELDFHASFIKNLHALDELSILQSLNCENTPLSAREVTRFQRRHPQAQVIFTFPPKKRRWLFW